MAGLLDFLQAASNAAASNVSGPVDAINWLLSKAGVPVSQSPVGGSQWMEQKGLTRKVPQGAASVLGETAGLLAPFAVAAKAPQIAGGLNQMVANAQTPATMNPQRGAIVWHGSPHKFDRFDSSKIGTGEGAQAYGHGLYLAENPGIAAGYADKLSQVSSDGGFTKIPRFATYGARRVDMNAPSSSLAPGELALTYANMEGGKANGLLALREMANDPYLKDSEKYKKAADILMRMNPKKIGADSGNLYKVDLPDEQIAKMLDWDKPLSQQAPEVQKALASLGYQYDAQAGASFDDALMAALEGTGSTSLPKMPRNPMGSEIARGNGLFDSPAQVAKAKALREAGIPGIRYLDGGSRGAGAGTSNYVVFPGGEDYLTILERNGISVR
jgi:hypothetical protein